MSRARKSALLLLALCGAQAVLGSCSDETPPAPPAPEPVETS